VALAFPMWSTGGSSRLCTVYSARTGTRPFTPSSHGFRPGCSCHTAIAETKTYLENGYEWVVDLDLEKFFDRVHHQRLMARLETKVNDRRQYERCFRRKPDRCVPADEVHGGATHDVGGALGDVLGRSAVLPDGCDMHLRRERPPLFKRGTSTGGRGGRPSRPRCLAHCCDGRAHSDTGGTKRRPLHRGEVAHAQGHRPTDVK
jgi:Reverse transcriptase (RNA-dependent DNA polymerase)